MDKTMGRNGRHLPKSLQAQTERARQVPALDLARSMIRGLPVDGYEIIKADRKEVYRDASFSMKLVEVYRSPVLHGYVIEVETPRTQFRGQFVAIGR